MSKATLKQAEKNILRQIAGLEDIPEGAYNIRVNGVSFSAASSDHIQITPKAGKPGIDITILPGTKGEKVHIPVVISESGVVETVYNDFYIGENAEVTIVAGCGIHNDGGSLAQHDGIHVFHVGKNAGVTYLEKHYGEGGGSGERVLNPVTEAYLDSGSYMEMDTVQIEGVHATDRLTRATLQDAATLVVREKLMTSGGQFAKTAFEVGLNGENASTHLVSRSVAKGCSRQIFLSRINGNNACAGHSECDAIIMDEASVQAIPEITANHIDSSLIHEAAIGKIAGEQIVKLQTLGLSEEEAIEEIVSGFLK